MKWKEKFSDYFWRFLKWMTPETEADRIVMQVIEMCVDGRGFSFTDESYKDVFIYSRDNF